MKTFWSMIAEPLRGTSRRKGIAVLAIAILAPLLIVVALTSTSDDETIPAAIVNLDVPIEDSSGTPIVAGKLLTQNMVTADDGVDWTLTDAQSAASGLSDGDFVAIVTIPADFSKDVATIGSSSPVAATIDVQTSTAHGYVGGVIADAVAARIPRGVSAELTTAYVSGTLDAFSALHDGLGDVADGVSGLESATNQAAEGAGELATATDDLAGGLREMAAVLDALPSGARDLGTLSAEAARVSTEIAESLASEAVRAELLAIDQQVTVDALTVIQQAIATDPTAPVSSLVPEISALTQNANGVSDQLVTQRDELAGDAVTSATLAVGADTIAEVTGPVAEGLGVLAVSATQAADGAALLGEGAAGLGDALGTIGGLTGELGSGVSEIADNVPNYSSDQQKAIAETVATPITTQTTAVAGPASSATATLAAVVPVALWLGALATFLVVAPYSRGALTTSVSAVRIVVDSAVVAVFVGVVQAILVGIAAAVAGIPVERMAVAFAFTVVTAMCFALVHQALVALLGRSGLVVSVVALGLQLVASGTLAAQGSDSIAGGPLAMLPMSMALQGAQALWGGSLHAVLASVLGLGGWAAVAVVISVIGVTRARSKSMRGLIASPSS